MDQKNGLYPMLPDVLIHSEEFGSNHTASSVVDHNKVSLSGSQEV